MDLAHLRQLSPLVTAQAPAMLEEFYAFLASAPATAALVPPEVAGHLKKQLVSYWQELTEGAFDRPYAASRMRIGVIHERIGIRPEAYLAGLAR